MGRPLTLMKLAKPTLPPGEAPTTLGGKILTSTPVIMTVVATLLAGLANSEMTRAQYDRSLAAQLQSKVGDQWSFFQAKKLRGATLKASLELLQATSDAGPLDPAALQRFVDLPPAAMSVLTTGRFPRTTNLPQPTASVAAGLSAAAENLPEALLINALHAVKLEDLDAGLAELQAFAKTEDVAVSAITAAVDKAETALLVAAGKRDGARQALRDFTAARFRLDAARYDNEARSNRAIAELTELKVRLTNLSAERHHKRSQRFFFGMLAAQLAVILATLGMAVKHRNLMWSFAAGIGLLAVAFGIYVYLWL